MLVASRFDYRQLRKLAPPLVLAALGLCAAVLVVAPEINGARRWLDRRAVDSFQPSELAKLALLVWAAAYLARNGPPQTLAELWRPIGMLTVLFAALILFEPDLGTTISLMLMLGGMLLVAGVPGRALQARPTVALRPGWPRSGSSRTAARASSASSTRGPIRRTPASRPCRRSSGSAPAASPARGSARASRRSTTCPSSRRT